MPSGVREGIKGDGGGGGRGGREGRGGRGGRKACRLLVFVQEIVLHYISFLCLIRTSQDVICSCVVMVTPVLSW